MSDNQKIDFQGKTVFITGGSRGIGRAIALKLAKEGANVAIAAKTDVPHPKLPGTIHSVAVEIEKAGGKALAVPCDIRSEEQVQQAINKCVEKFGGLDILVNNASAIDLTGTLDVSMKKYDLMHQVNLRGTFMVSKYALPHLIESAKKNRNPHILNLSPPLSMKERWFSPHVAYSMAKYGMSMCVLGMAGEFKEYGVAVNALWPLTTIATSAIDLISGEETRQKSRTDVIMADAAYVIFSQPSNEFTGNFCIDEQILRQQGVTDFSKYSVVPGETDLLLDFFVDEDYQSPLAKRKVPLSKL